MDNLSKLLQNIKDNPAMYLGKPSITCLHSFLNGYLDARNDLKLEREGAGIEAFQEWVQKREKTTVSQSWAGIILFISGSERTAFNNFFKIFEEFLKQNKSLIKEENEKTNKAAVNDLSFPPRELYELIDGIKKRPGMYLGSSSITKLDMLLRGYSLARREVGIPQTEQEREFEGFQSWIPEKYKINSGQSWAKIILFYSMDEQEALERFFGLFEEYLNCKQSSGVNSLVQHGVNKPLIANQ